MPYIEKSSYQPPLWLRNAHANTIFPALFRKVEGVIYQRERLSTPDGDFLDLDWSRTGSDQLLIILHGLEGAADRPYIRGMARHFNRAGWDALGMNFRSCSGEMNRSLRTYHMGETSDLDLIITRIRERGEYDKIALAGFSLGGNVILKYLEEKGSSAPVFRAVVFSVPCQISSANLEIDRFRNSMYLRRFLRSLNAKMRIKAQQFPGHMPDPLPQARSFREFDDRFTAPVHGFADAMDYWTRCSTVNDLHRIRVPVLMVNAQDDTFLSAGCYPRDQARMLDHFFLEIPRYGGHVGFTTRDRGGTYWSEVRALRFIEEGA
jgi:predicted alpha/beta-fold hydrolase